MRSRTTRTLLATGTVMAALFAIPQVARAEERQTQNVEDEFTYELRVPQLVHAYIARTESCSTSSEQDRVAAEGLRFVLLRTVISDGKKFQLVRFPQINPENPHQLEALTSSLPEADGNDIIRDAPDSSSRLPAKQQERERVLRSQARQFFVTSDDNGQYFCLEQEKIDALFASQGAVKVYRRGQSGYVYGLSLVLPFKVRRATGDFNTKLSESITIAGALGVRWRISDTFNYHLIAPIGYAGLTTLDLEMGTAPAAMTGNKQILGLTGSVGAVLELGDFQVGFMAGIDRAPGSDGKGWVYNDKIWYSFAFGYSFLSNGSR